MPLWGNTDTANDAVKFAGSLVAQAPTAATRNALFGNTTGVGIFGVDAAETSATAGVTHPGWIKRTVGTGGRAGRVFNETLVAMGSIMGADANDDDAFKDVTLKFTTQPSNAVSSNSAPVTFSVATSSSPVTPMTYQWQANTGAGFVNVADGNVYSNSATASLYVANTSGLNQAQYRVLVSAAGANTITSRKTTLTVS